MTSDFRAFAMAPKTIVPAGGSITAANLRAAAGALGDFKTPYIYAAFGDVILTTGTITNPVTVTGGQATFSGMTLKAGSILPLARGITIDLSASASPALILFFAT